MLGPVLIAAMILISWLDGLVEGAAIPAGLHTFLGRESAPPGVVIGIAISGLIVAASLELTRIFRANSIAASSTLTAAVALLGFAISTIAPAFAPSVAGPIVATACVAALLASMLHHTRDKTVEGAIAAAGATLFSFVYLGVLFSFFMLIRQQHSAWVVLGVLLVIKSCDIGAYFTGMALGRRKLIPWLSPGKTWEGLIGGVITAGAIAALLAAVAPQDSANLTVTQAAIAGVIFGLVGQAGDLAASLLKRDAGIKDSSRVLPGFGGVLDVIDSPLLVAPIAFWLLHSLA